MTRPIAALLIVLTAGALAGAASAATSSTRFEGRKCTPPKGHKIADCRVGRHGTPDLSRAAWRALRNAEVTISRRFDRLAPQPGRGRRAQLAADRLARPADRPPGDRRGRAL